MPQVWALDSSPEGEVRTPQREDCGVGKRKTSHHPCALPQLADRAGRTVKLRVARVWMAFLSAGPFVPQWVLFRRGLFSRWILESHLSTF